MIRIAVCGAMGRMGHAIIEAVNEKKDEFEIVALVDQEKHPSIGKKIAGLKLSSDLSANLKDADVVIDFSNPDASLSHLRICTEFKKAIVVGTTSLSDEFKAQVQVSSGIIPLLVAGNMSIGANALSGILKKAANLLKDYDIEIIEKHHRYKKDAPSGTALMLAQSISDTHEHIHGRYGKNLSRPENIIGIHAVRAGNIVGEHEVIFAGNDEVIKLSHSAGSRKIFAYGALKAAQYIANKDARAYTMSEVLNL